MSSNRRWILDGIDGTHNYADGRPGWGTIIALETEFTRDHGAHPTLGEAITYNTINHLVGPYRVPNYTAVGRNVVTHKTFIAAYRGAGRPEAAYFIERGMALLVVDPALGRIGEYFVRLLAFLERGFRGKHGRFDCGMAALDPWHVDEARRAAGEHTAGETEPLTGLVAEVGARRLLGEDARHLPAAEQDVGDTAQHAVTLELAALGALSPDGRLVASASECAHQLNEVRRCCSVACCSSWACW